MPVSMTESPETRHSLLVRLKDHDDQQAWTEFYEIYEPLIYRLARVCGLQDADAREVVQTVCLSVSRSIGQFRHAGRTGCFRAWLRQVTRNQTINQLKQCSRHPGLGDGPEAVQWDQLQHDAAPPDQVVGAKFDREHRRQVFCWAAEKIQPRFSPVNWQAFWRTCVDGESIASVAEALNLSPSQVHVARCRIIARIREVVTQHTAPEP
ncbi:MULTISPECIES: RNA polymerase sigma factor [Crateriforma]|uniref:RNA polymerase sigma factor n=1 Tax=Crateriforma conspicua TaxID=2527996 RepID=A0A5C6FWH9_9PLAN|nr:MULTISPECIES: sigma-70 family RNA polymerase sigma factor [Crateriforma]TWU65373.1 RNA polymerase sigma factor [Crateriforma conspicua]